jgi:hypothetical protein
VKVLCLLALVVCAAPLSAQQQPPPPPAPVRADTLILPQDTSVQDTVPDRRERGDSVGPRPPITPAGAFLRSLILPGWGQSRLGRNVTGGLFVAFEALAAAMVWKSDWQLEFARARNRFVEEKRQEREDWITLLVFNHLVAASEAYVSAHLADFPPALKVRRLPGGGVGVGFTIPTR